MKRQILVIFFLLIMCSYASAEIVAGAANMRERPRGRVSAYLKNGAHVELIPGYMIRDKWFRVGFVVYVKPDALTEDIMVKKGADFHNEKGLPIGRARSTFRYGWDIRKKNGLVGIVIDEAYTHRDNIKKNTVPEFEIKRVIESYKKKTPSFEAFGDLILKFGFTQWKTEDEFSVYDIKDSWIYDITPKVRTALVFKKNKLVAVVHPSFVSFGRAKPFAISGDHAVSYIGKASKELKNDIQIKVLKVIK